MCRRAGGSLLSLCVFLPILAPPPKLCFLSRLALPTFISFSNSPSESSLALPYLVTCKAHLASFFALARGQGIEVRSEAGLAPTRGGRRKTLGSVEWFEKESIVRQAEEPNISRN